MIASFENIYDLNFLMKLNIQILKKTKIIFGLLLKFLFKKSYYFKIQIFTKGFVTQR